MAAAQGHADWIVSTGNGGHTGAGGSDETMRAYWAGYGGGKSIKCDEAWARTSSVESAVYNAWADWTHQQVMLNGWGNNYVDVGAGVADNGDGTYVFILDVCLTQGGSAPNVNPNTPVDPNATPDMSNYIFGVAVATPAPDGSIVHIVQFGQSLASISKAYEITINELRALNNMATDSTLIWPDQKLLIKRGNTTPVVAGTQSLTGTPEPLGAATGTITLAPTFTPRPRTSTPVVEGTISFTQTVVPTISATAKTNQQKQTFGLILIIACGLGLIGIAYTFFKK